MSENIIEEVVIEPIEEVETEVEPEVEFVEAVQMKVGRVIDCPKLNIRSDAFKSSRIVCVVDRGTEMEVDESESTVHFYKVYLDNGFYGFAMKQFIEII